MKARGIQVPRLVTPLIDPFAGAYWRETEPTPPEKPGENEGETTDEQLHQETI